MDLVHKYHMDNMWTKLVFRKSKVIEEGTDVNKTYLIIGVTVAIFVLIVLLLIGIFIYRKQKRRQKQRLSKKDRKCIHRCKKNLGWHIIDKSSATSKEWIDYIIPKMDTGTLSVSRLEGLHGALKEAKHESEYSKDMVVLFIYVRIFVLPSIITPHNNRSLKLLMKLLRDRDTDKSFKHSIYRLKYLSEPMMGCLEDLSDKYSNNDSIHPLIEALIPFVAYWTIVDPYIYHRNPTFLQLYLCGDESEMDESVQLWATVILCYYGDGCTYMDNLRHYLENLRKYLDKQLIIEKEVSESEMIIYAALIRGAVSKDIQWTLIDTDYRIINALNNNCDKLTEWSIREISDNIIKVFIDKYKDGIIDGCYDNISLREDQKSSIKCLSVSLKNASSDNFDNILSLFDELYPLLTNNNYDNIAVMEDMAVSIIDYLYGFGRYRSESIKKIIFGICYKYSSIGSVSDKIK